MEKTKVCKSDVKENTIICPTCQNKISDVTLLRCPRCFSSLLKMGCSGNCSKCEQA